MSSSPKFLLAAAAIALASGAQAQIDNIQSKTDATLQINSANVVLPTPVPSPEYRSAGVGGAGYSTSAISQGGSIFFQAGSMSAGTLNSASSKVEVSFDFTNNTGQVVDRAVSTVFSSNFGMFVTNFANFPPSTPENPNPPAKAACTGASLPNCTPIAQGPGMSGIGTLVDQTPPFTLAYTEFLFEIVQDGETRKAIGGSLQLDTDGNGNLTRTTGGLFDSLASELNDFEQFDTNYLDRVWAFSWGDTDVAALLNPIGIGQKSSLTYRITTRSWTDAFYSRSVHLNTIVSFACFADPVGRGGSAAAILTVPGFEVAPCDDYREGAITNYSLKIAPGGNTLFLTRDGAPVIPEPDTWAMLIVGFGLVGLSMRRGKKAATTAA